MANYFVALRTKDGQQLTSAELYGVETVSEITVNRAGGAATVLVGGREVAAGEIPERVGKEKLVLVRFPFTDDEVNPRPDFDAEPVIKSV